MHCINRWQEHESDMPISGLYSACFIPTPKHQLGFWYSFVKWKHIKYVHSSGLLLCPFSTRTVGQACNIFLLILPQILLVNTSRQVEFSISDNAQSLAFSTTFHISQIPYFVVLIWTYFIQLSILNCCKKSILVYS